MKCQMVIYTQTWWDSSTRAWTENWKRENCKGKWVVLMALLLYPNVKAWTHKQGCKKKKFSLSVSNAHDSLWAFMRQAKNNMNTLLHRITHRHYLRTSTASEGIFQSYLCNKLQLAIRLCVFGRGRIAQAPQGSLGQQQSTVFSLCSSMVH